MDISCNRLEVLFQFYLWDQSHITIVWNTRETGDKSTIGCSGFIVRTQRGPTSLKKVPALFVQFDFLEHVVIWCNRQKQLNFKTSLAKKSGKFNLFFLVMKSFRIIFFALHSRNLSIGLKNWWEQYIFKQSSVKIHLAKTLQVKIPFIFLPLSHITHINSG